MITKCVILCGGYGTRLSEETYLKPKPMIEIGGKPILWHIMKYYSSFGVKEFFLCLGYKGWVIKDYFINYSKLNSDLIVNLSDNSYTINKKNTNEDWKIHLIDTGQNSMTGGRILRMKTFFKKNENFYCTYGDGLSNIDIKKLYKCHLKSNCIATVSAVQNPGRFGSLNINNQKVIEFVEKPVGDNSWINGGFFVFNTKVFNYIKSDKTILESETLVKLAKIRELNSYTHKHFWRPMDTKRDLDKLNEIYESPECPWKVW